MTFERSSLDLKLSLDQLLAPISTIIKEGQRTGESVQLRESSAEAFPFSISITHESSKIVSRWEAYDVYLGNKMRGYFGFHIVSGYDDRDSVVDRIEHTLPE